MTRAIVAGVLAGLLMAGCKPKPYMGTAKDLHVEMGSRQEPVEAPQLTPSPVALGPEAPYLPLVQPPEVRRVWVTAHLNEAGDMIAGHWVYLMLEPSQWYLRGYKGPQDLKLKVPARAPIALPPAEGQ
ncbi:MAG: TraV family lipoprotein [Candidatus Tectomicrobia bacterium]|nr:TraV family lipoprotein [Candidatus Tectomicrobia bacterium]